MWGVVDVAWSPGLQAEHDQREQARDVAYTEEWARDADRDAADKVAAAAGDAEAKGRLELRGKLQALTGSLRRSPRPQRNAIRRNCAGAEARLNPSRVLAGLARRGLVQRDRGIARLTDAGRAAAVPRSGE